MKRTVTLAIACLLCLLLHAGPAGAENITWPDNGTLRPDLVWSAPGSLFPDAASGNTVTVNADVAGHVYGGVMHSADSVSDNRVFINSGTVDGYVYGGYSLSGAATANKVNISDGAIIGAGGFGLVYGGYSDSGAATGNSVNVSGGVIGAGTSGYIYGGRSAGSGAATDNKVNISGGTIIGKGTFGQVSGGYSTGSGAATGNEVSIRGDAIIGKGAEGQIYGGYSLSGEATGNKVNVSGGTIIGAGADGWVYGGFSDSGAATGNEVSINGDAIIGKDTFGSVYGGFSDSGEATGNKMNISDGAIIGAGADGWVYGGYSTTGAASYNSVSVSGGIIGAGAEGAVYGGCSDGSGAASYNSVSVSGGVIGADAYGVVYGGYSDSGEATGNSVSVSGGHIGAAAYGWVYGGYSYDSGAVTGNSVSISGGRIGTFGDDSIVAGGSSFSGSATHNAVTLAGNPDLRQAAVYGGHTTGAATDLFKGNTLNVLGYSGTVRGVQNFEFYNFVLPNTLGNGGTLITIDSPNPAAILPANRMDETTIGVAMQGGGNVLKPGDQIALLSRTSAPLADTYNFSGVSKGFSLLYDLEGFYDGAKNNALTLRVRAVGVNPQTKAVAESLIAPLALVNQGGDLVAGEGMRAAMNADLLPGSRMSAYFAASGGWSRYNSGSHVDVSGASIMAGLAWKPELPRGRITFGPFFEAGWGSYNTDNSFSNAADVEGDGTTEYYGGGLLGRYDASCGGYVEASVRIGGVRNDYHSDDLRDPFTGRKADYDKTRTYYGAHAGIGYVWSIGEQAALDMYAKYFWTRQEGFSTDVGDDPYTFDDADSHRLRGGARFSYAINEQVVPYIGAAYEYEFDGEIKATTYGSHKVDRPNLEGGTGMGELGLTVKPDPYSGFSMDLGAQGYVGVREGVTGSLRLKYEF